MTLLALLPGASYAQLTFSGGVEHFLWDEATDPSVEESGVLFAFSLGYTQQANEGLALAYRGRLWMGTVDYTGATLFTNQPLTGTTGYFGVTNEGQARWRAPIRGSWYRWNIVGGLGIDAWRRELSSVQREDYTVVYLRSGVEVDSNSARSWQFAIGAKYPVWVREDAHLTNIGFDRNPELNPGGKVSAYLQLGYRMDHQWQVTGYLEGYRFSPVNGLK